MIRAIITGATGMVGGGVLLECLESDSVESVLVVGRSSVAIEHPKLNELLVNDFRELSLHSEALNGYTSCFFCLGSSAAGKSEGEFHGVTYDLCIGFAEMLQAQNDSMTFAYVSGAGCDSTEKGTMMWARVKGKTENKLLEMFGERAFMFRPGYIQPLKGVRSKTRLYAVPYMLFSWLYPLLKHFPSKVTDTVRVGKSMIAVAEKGYTSNHIEVKDINLIAGE
ncbi:MAG: hypothetical protein OCC49_18220 [Fibrobacterales bacterium]